MLGRTLCTAAGIALLAAGTTHGENTNSTPSKSESSKLEPFTGKVTSDKVRLRLQPNLECGIIRELAQGELLEIVDELDGFYAVRPTRDQRAYVFRTFVLDGTIEGQRVNVRLAPDLDAPVIAQLNTGDHVDGCVSAENNKWVEISPPSTVTFYVAADYITKEGPVGHLAQVERRHQEAERMLRGAELSAEAELRKPFEEASIRTVTTKFDQVIRDYTDCPHHVARAQKGLEQCRQRYTEKRIAYLEAKAGRHSTGTTAASTAPSLDSEIDKAREQLAALEGEVRNSTTTDSELLTITSTESWNNNLPTFTSDLGKSRDGIWEPIEEAIYQSWAAGHEDASIYEFYDDQHANSTMLIGVLQPYSQPVKNKPGDYILVDPTTSLPLAYLYSTSVELNGSIGKLVSVTGAERPNNNFAYPAYYALSVEEG